MIAYQGQDCPKCGCDHHYIANASMPTINECCNCHHYWNPNNIPFVSVSKGDKSLNVHKDVDAINVTYDAGPQYDVELVVLTVPRRMAA